MCSYNWWWRWSLQNRFRHTVHFIYIVMALKSISNGYKGNRCCTRNKLLCISHSHSHSYLWLTLLRWCSSRSWENNEFSSWEPWLNWALSSSKTDLISFLVARSLLPSAVARLSFEDFSKYCCDTCSTSFWPDKSNWEKSWCESFQASYFIYWQTWRNA